jgi:hypothetical protein
MLSSIIIDKVKIVNVFKTVATSFDLLEWLRIIAQISNANSSVLLGLWWRALYNEFPLFAVDRHTSKV